MDPVYSRDECVAAIRDYYDFLANMYMDPSLIVEPPQFGWLHITPETTKDLGKTEEVVELLRHLPYIKRRMYCNDPQTLPGGNFINWAYIIREIEFEETHPENELGMSEGNPDHFEGKIPSHCIGLIHGGFMFDRWEQDYILLDTRSGVIYWMNCPTQIKQSAAPQSSYWVYPLERESQGAIESKEQDSESNKGEGTHEDEDREDEEGEDNEEDDDDDEEDDIRWGPCWPVRHFFEMLKNQFRQLNFIPKDEMNVIDIWYQAEGFETPIPEGFTDFLQAIYRKHGWPDMSKYRKDNCLAELKQEMNERYPEHRYFYDRHAPP